MAVTNLEQDCNTSLVSYQGLAAHISLSVWVELLGTTQALTTGTGSGQAGKRGVGALVGLKAASAADLTVACRQAVPQQDS